MPEITPENLPHEPNTETASAPLVNAINLKGLFYDPRLSTVEKGQRIPIESRLGHARRVAAGVLKACFSRGNAPQTDVLEGQVFPQRFNVTEPEYRQLSSKELEEAILDATRTIEGFNRAKRVNRALGGVPFKIIAVVDRFRRS